MILSEICRNSNQPNEFLTWCKIAVKMKEVQMMYVPKDAKDGGGVYLICFRYISEALKLMCL